MYRSLIFAVVTFVMAIATAQPKSLTQKWVPIRSDEIDLSTNLKAVSLKSGRCSVYIQKNNFVDLSSYSTKLSGLSQGVHNDISIDPLGRQVKNEFTAEKHRQQPKADELKDSNSQLLWSLCGEQLRLLPVDFLQALHGWHNLPYTPTTPIIQPKKKGRRQVFLASVIVVCGVIGALMIYLEVRFRIRNNILKKQSG